MPARTTAASVQAALHDQTRNTMARIESSENSPRNGPSPIRRHQHIAQPCPGDADMDAEPDQGREDQQSHGASLATCAMAADHPDTARGNRAMQYTPPPHVTQHWQLSKPSAKGRRGMVVSQAKGAAEAGVAVLDAGGNAIDAAVATALALATHEPWNSGLGGIGFALVHRAGQKRAEVVDFGPRAPAATDPGALQADRAHDDGPVRLAGGRGRHQHPRPAVGRHSRLGRGLRLHAPAMGQAAAGRGDRAGHRAGEARPAAGLVHRAEGRHLGARRSGSIRRRRAVYLPNGLPPAPPYQGKPGFFRQGNLPDTLERLGRAGSARLLRGRDRRLGRRRRQGAGRRAVARGPAQLPGAKDAASTPPVAPGAQPPEGETPWA